LILFIYWHKNLQYKWYSYYQALKYSFYFSTGIFKLGIRPVSILNIMFILLTNSREIE
jgi:hypothetical protein